MRLGMKAPVYTFVIVFGLFPNAGKSDTFGVRFTGTVDNVSASSDAALPTGLSLGSTVNGTIQYETNNASLAQYTDTGVAMYTWDPSRPGSSIGLDFGGTTWTSGPSLTATVTNDVPPDGSGYGGYNAAVNDRLAFEWDTIWEPTPTNPLPNSSGSDYVDIRFYAGNNDGRPVTLATSTDLPGTTPNYQFDPTTVDYFYAAGQVGTGSWNVGFSIDPSSLSLINQASSPSPSSSLVYLDFDSGVPLFVSNVSTPLGTLTLTTNSRVPSYPSSNLTQSERDAVQARLTNLFADAGANVTFTQTRPSTGDFVTVDFGQTIGGSSLLGLAFDEGGPLPLIDRFNRYKSGEVAVFMSGSTSGAQGSDTYTPVQIADTAAHEIGHTYGLMHTDASSLNAPFPPDAIMSANASLGSFATFVSEPAPLDLGPITTSAATQNSVYHLRRYVNGETDAQLQAQGLTPGTWDNGTVLSGLISFAVGSLSGQVDQWYMLTSLSASNGGADSPFLIDLSSRIINGVLSLPATSDQPFGIVGRSSGSDLVDFFVGSGDDPKFGGKFTLDDFQSGQFGIFHSTMDGASVSFVAPLAVSVSDLSVIGPGGSISTVPLPGGFQLLLGGFLSLVLFGRRKSSRKT